MSLQGGWLRTVDVALNRRLSELGHGENGEHPAKQTDVRPQLCQRHESTAGRARASHQRKPLSAPYYNVGDIAMRPTLPGTTRPSAKRNPMTPGRRRAR